MKGIQIKPLDEIRDTVFHKTFISVDEGGTEDEEYAAAVMKKVGSAGFVIGMTIDHPFIFLVCDVDSGTILFIGRVMNP